MKHNTFVTHRKLFLIAAVLACACFSFPAPAYQFNTSDGANYGSTDSAFRVYWDNATDTLKLYSAASGTSGNPITWIEGLTMGTSGASLFQVDNDAGACTAAKLGRLRYNGTSTWEYCNNATTWTALGASPELSALTAATGTNTINSGANTQEWQWNTLAGATGLKLSSTSTAAAGDAQKLFEIALSGANGTATQTTYGAYIANTHTGATSTNVGLYASASGGTNNYAAIFENGNVGIGTASPAAPVHINKTTTTGNGVEEVLRLSHEDSNSAASTAIGAALTFYLEDSVNGTTRESSKIVSAWDDATDASKDGVLIFYTMGPDAGAGVTAGTERMRITSSGNVGVGTISPASKFVVAPPASEAIAGAATITANACGTIKQITSVGNVTTNTTNTFTSPTASYAGCCMDVVNVDAADTITLDANTAFKTIGGADQALGPDDTIRVCSNGTNWYQVGAVAGNQ